MNELPLRDIHMPDAISWWPLAPGWWLLIIMVLISPLFLRYVWRIWQDFKNSPLRLARQNLLQLQQEFHQHRNKHLLLQQVSMLLKQTVIAQHPEQAWVAGLQGQEWLSFLDDSMNGQAFAEGAGRCLLHGPYQKDLEDYDSEALFSLVQDWLKHQGKH